MCDNIDGEVFMHVGMNFKQDILSEALFNPMLASP